MPGPSPRAPPRCCTRASTAVCTSPPPAAATTRLAKHTAAASARNQTRMQRVAVAAASRAPNDHLPSPAPHHPWHCAASSFPASLALRRLAAAAAAWRLAAAAARRRLAAATPRRRKPRRRSRKKVPTSPWAAFSIKHFAPRAPRSLHHTPTLLHPHFPPHPSKKIKEKLRNKALFTTAVNKGKSSFKGSVWPPACFSFSEENPN